MLDFDGVMHVWFDNCRRVSPWLSLGSICSVRYGMKYFNNQIPESESGILEAAPRLSANSLSLLRVSDDEFHSRRMFPLSASSPSDRVMTLVQHTALVHLIARMNTRCERFNTRFNSRQPAENFSCIIVHHLGITYQITYHVTDVEGPVAAVSSMNDGGMMVVFSPQGALVFDGDTIEARWKHRCEA